MTVGIPGMTISGADGRNDRRAWYDWRVILCGQFDRAGWAAELEQAE
jgi:hypothetical protein